MRGLLSTHHARPHTKFRIVHRSSHLRAGWHLRHDAVDKTLVKALARARRWQRMVDSSGFSSSEELAKAERINPSYLARVLRLTLLAPDIVESILNGRHDPATIRMERLMRPFSATWGEQLQRL
jgi:hypothetical protein